MFIVSAARKTIRCSASLQPKVEEAMRQIAEVMRVRRHLPSNKLNDFALFSDDAFLSLYNTVTGGIVALMTLISSISLLVGGIGVMNIMLVTVTERTREIGIRKALGARRRDILTQFLVESTTLSLSGGILGIAIGVSLALLVGAVSPLPAAVSLPAVLLGLLMSTLIGVFFGSYPALRAARLDPIEALRYE